jgi:hypothetical protein
VDNAWICPCGFEFGAGPERTKRRRRHRHTVYETEPEEAERRVHRGRSRRRGPLFATIWLALLSLHWVALMVLIYFYRRHPLTAGDLFVGSIGCMLALFYLWVAYAVYCRRRYIWDIAMVCAGIWLIAIPTGTILALLIFGNLLSAKSDFTR